jgi:hypothetical protein
LSILHLSLTNQIGTVFGRPVFPCHRPAGGIFHRPVQTEAAPHTHPFGAAHVGNFFPYAWYIVFSRLHLMDSYTALILSHMLIALPVVVALIRATTTAALTRGIVWRTRLEAGVHTPEFTPGFFILR